MDFRLTIKFKRWLCKHGWHKFAVVVHVTPNRKYPVRWDLYCERCSYMRRTDLYEYVVGAAKDGWNFYIV